MNIIKVALSHFCCRTTVQSVSKAGGLPTLPFPLSLPSSFPFPLSFQTNQWEGRSDPVRGSSPASPPPTNTTLLVCDPLAHVTQVCDQVFDLLG